jgi:pimeloyl-ACP methyl ester carboxylesterase
MERLSFKNDGLTLSYLDWGGPGKILIALHSHWMEGATFVPLATALTPEWRVVAPDQRGHGYSDHALSYRREDYLSDLGALFSELDLKEPTVLLGNSLGGVNAYQFAARTPHLVRALIIEDVGAEISLDTRFVLQWAGTFATKEELEQKASDHLRPCLQDSLRETPQGWRLAFDPKDMVASQEQINGNHWTDWLATSCPALLIRGQDSRLTSLEHLEEMASRRANTRLLIVPGGHIVHLDNPSAFAGAVKDFLNELTDSELGATPPCPLGPPCV